MFSKTIVLGALAAVAAAQSAVLTFTNVPNPITDGQAQAITYATNDTTNPVSILLRQGPSDDLKTIETLTEDATGGQFIWTPSTSLPNGNNYALQIKQGDEINYFGPFTVQGASSSASSASGRVPSVSASPIVSANGTSSVPVIVTPVGTGASASGTGSPISRNTTLSSATLTATTSSSGSDSTGTSTDDAGFQGTGSSTDAPESTGAASSFQVGSGIALFGAIAAGVFLQEPEDSPESTLACFGTLAAAPPKAQDLSLPVLCAEDELTSRVRRSPWRETGGLHLADLPNRTQKEGSWVPAAAELPIPFFEMNAGQAQRRVAPLSTGASIAGGGQIQVPAPSTGRITKRILFFASISSNFLSFNAYRRIIFSVLSPLQHNIITMRFSTSTLLAVAAAPLLAAAQGGESNGSNPFDIPKESLNTEAGQTVDLTWKPTTEGTVTIYLRSGASNNLNKGTPIAASIDNSGSFTWEVPEDIVRGSNYALEIVDDSNDENTNYTPPFVIESENNAAPSSASSTDDSSSTTASSTASETDSSSAASETETETDSAVSTVSGLFHSSSSSVSAMPTNSSNGTMTTSTRSSTSATSTSDSDSDDDAQTVAASEGGASRMTTTFAGLLGLVAVGALAL
ncbi:hypothetical protein Q7P37_009276 [Cladosporium fusiforme]